MRNLNDIHFLEIAVQELHQCYPEHRIDYFVFDEKRCLLSISGNQDYISTLPVIEKANNDELRVIEIAEYQTNGYFSTDLYLSVLTD